MRRRYLKICLLALLSALWGAGVRGEPPARSFLMGTSAFFATSKSFPDWRFENDEDRDIVSLHADDFWGIPWDSFKSGAPPPSAWAAKWEDLKKRADASGKTVYVAVTFMGGDWGRRNLVSPVDGKGNKTRNPFPRDRHGCYQFARDKNAEANKNAYLNYCRYIIDLIHPRYFSPALEMNMPFYDCPDVKEGIMSWYADIYRALKDRYPDLVIFPTIQVEHCYGIGVARAGGGYDATFRQRFRELLALPMDRIGLSLYPVNWAVEGRPPPVDTFAVIRSMSEKKIFVGETGFPAAKIQVSGKVIASSAIVNDIRQDAYLAWLLREAQDKRFEAVIWWLNRDIFDKATAESWPPEGDPATVDFIRIAKRLRAELGMRVFANMGLRHYNGSPRPALSTWRSYLKLPLE